jgi:Family of unknown function (DUF5330)
MRFLLKLAFWLTIVVLLMPSDRAQQGAAAPQVGAGDAVTATGAAVADVRQFCVRQPDACAVGSQALVEFGQKAKAGAKMLYDFLGEKVGHEPAHGNDEQIAGVRKPSQSTLTPADLAVPWRGPPPRRNADTRHPA